MTSSARAESSTFQERINSSPLRSKAITGEVNSVSAEDAEGATENEEKSSKPINCYPAWGDRNSGSERTGRTNRQQAQPSARGAGTGVLTRAFNGAWASGFALESGLLRGRGNNRAGLRFPRHRSRAPSGDRWHSDCL